MAMKLEEGRAVRSVDKWFLNIVSAVSSLLFDVIIQFVFILLFYFLNVNMKYLHLQSFIQLSTLNIQILVFFQRALVNWNTAIQIGITSLEHTNKEWIFLKINLMIIFENYTQYEKVKIKSFYYFFTWCSFGNLVFKY